MELKDSGNRREFSTGAVRDINEGKGRCDLLPIGVVGAIDNDPLLLNIGKYVREGDKTNIVKVIKDFSNARYGDLYTAMLEVSKHYEDGCNSTAQFAITSNTSEETRTSRMTERSCGTSCVRCGHTTTTPTCVTSHSKGAK